MQEISNSIIPKETFFICKNKSFKIQPTGESFDYKSIAIFSAIGFFLSDNTYYNDGFDISKKNPSKLKVDELRELVVNKNLKSNEEASKLKKGDLIKLLE